ncbi:MAG: hypothetical protein WKF40_00515 [Thermoleophilaceae bacterium]
MVVSTAIGEDNAELVAARDAGAPVIHRGRLLGEVSALKRSIAVAGTHGKTTTCAMIAHVLSGCGRRPAFLIGGELRSAGTNAAWGRAIGSWWRPTSPTAPSSSSSARSRWSPTSSSTTTTPTPP